MMAAHRQRYHVPVTLATSGVPRALPPDAALALLRTAQEAMVNAAKHAPGHHVAVRLDYDDQTTSGSASSTALDRAGPPRFARPGNTGGYGLTGMRERLRLLNGTLGAGPRENEWIVTAQLPLPAAEGGLAAGRGGSPDDCRPAAPGRRRR